jgi:hypothetical protein
MRGTAIEGKTNAVIDCIPRPSLSTAAELSSAIRLPVVLSKTHPRASRSDSEVLL